MSRDHDELDGAARLPTGKASNIGVKQMKGPFEHSQPAIRQQASEDVVGSATPTSGQVCREAAFDHPPERIEAVQTSV